MGKVLSPACRGDFPRLGTVPDVTHFTLAAKALAVRGGVPTRG